MHSSLPSASLCFSRQTEGGRSMSFVKQPIVQYDRLVMHKTLWFSTEHTHTQSRVMDIESNGKFLLCSKQVVLSCGFRRCHQHTQMSVCQFVTDTETVCLQCAEKTMDNSNCGSLPPMHMFVRVSTCSLWLCAAADTTATSPHQLFWLLVACFVPQIPECGRNIFCQCLRVDDWCHWSYAQHRYDDQEL